jgi:hypothetical protein
MIIVFLYFTLDSDIVSFDISKIVEAKKIDASNNYKTKVFVSVQNDTLSYVPGSCGIDPRNLSCIRPSCSIEPSQPGCPIIPE